MDHPARFLVWFQARVTEIDASYVVVLSHPNQVAAVMESGLAYDILAYDPKRRQLTLPCSALSLTADDEDRGVNDPCHTIILVPISVSRAETRAWT